MGLKCFVLPLNLYYDLKKTMKHGGNVSVEKNLLVVSESIVQFLLKLEVFM